jgi:predicted HicB family RNase H-like nuclease
MMSARKYELLMKAKITIKLDKDLLREARSMAAEQGISISALLAAELEEAVGNTSVPRNGP